MSLLRFIQSLSNKKTLPELNPAYVAGDVFSGNPGSFYRFAGVMDRNPNNGKVVHVYTKGTTHYQPGDAHTLMVRTKDSATGTFGAESIIRQEVNVQHADTGGGYLDDGRFFVISTRWDATNVTQLSRIYAYSDDDGQTFSSWQTLPDTTLLDYTAVVNPFSHYPIKLVDGRWAFAVYSRDLQTSPTVAQFNLFLSSDNGATWDETILVYEYNPNIEYLVEPSLFSKGNQYFINCRVLNQSYFAQFVATDPNTWTRQANYDLGETIGGTGTLNTPTYMTRPFQKNGVNIFGLLYYLRTSDELKIVYALQDELASGSENWDESTKTLLQGISGGLTGYQSYFMVGDTAYGIIWEEVEEGGGQKRTDGIEFSITL